VFDKVLIANRGEIAIRILKACQEMGVKTVAIYSDVDAHSPHVHLADEAVCLGNPLPSESYLNIPKIIDAAVDTKTEAVHPGYGFLAENADFANACKHASIKFIGPEPQVIELMGDKIEAKQKMETADVPIIPGYHDIQQENDFLVEQGQNLGFPLLVKAAAGGGGKGMRIVHEIDKLKEAIEGAKREAKSSFGSDVVFLEKYIDKPRHVEFQILADEHGNIIHLYERECSIQRRHQKVIEESPSPVMNAELRKKMGKAAVTAAKAVGYTNAGTIEFMVDAALNFYFMEMNTRLQVEHPITEVTTGVDIVKWQLRIASGEKLTLQQKNISQRGHAIECRIYAEDPTNGFLPCSGMLTKVEPLMGPNIRNDMGIETGMEITAYYDPLLAKLIVSAENRKDAIDKMIWALSHYIVMGITTNISFLKEVLDHHAFRDGDITTHFIDTHFKDILQNRGEIPIEALIALSVYDILHLGPVKKDSGVVSTPDPHSPWKHAGKWRLGD